MKRTLLTLGLISLSILTLFPQNFSMTLSGGLSRDVRLVTGNAWKTGYCIGTDMFFVGNQNVRFGAHLAFHHWTVDGEGLLEDQNRSNKILFSSLGSHNVFELFPTVQWFFTKAERIVQAGIQLGAGVLLISGTTPQIRYTYSDEFESGTETITYQYKNPVGYGLMIGVPLKVASLIQVMPAYCLYMNDYLYNHFSVVLGVRF